MFSANTIKSNSHEEVGGNLTVSGNTNSNTVGKTLGFSSTSSSVVKYLLLDFNILSGSQGFGGVLMFATSSWTNGVMGTVSMFRLFNSTNVNFSFSNVVKNSNATVSVVRVSLNGGQYIGLRITNSNVGSINYTYLNLSVSNMITVDTTDSNVSTLQVYGSG